jgi:hypothetical protein
MTWNPHDPTKPGEYQDWVDHTQKYNDAGVGRNTTHEQAIAKPPPIFGPGTSSSGAAPTSSPAAWSGTERTTSSHATTSGAYYLGGAERIRGGNTTRGGFVSGTFGILISVSFIFGGYERLANHSSVDASFDTASRAVSRVIGLGGNFVAGIDHSSPWLSGAGQVIKFAGDLLGICSGLAAGAGNGATLVGIVVVAVGVEMLNKPH